MHDTATGIVLSAHVCHFPWPPTPASFLPLRARRTERHQQLSARYSLRTEWASTRFRSQNGNTTAMVYQITSQSATFPILPELRRVRASPGNAEFKAIQLTRHAICPQWNYTIRPRASPENTE